MTLMLLKLLKARLDIPNMGENFFVLSYVKSVDYESMTGNQNVGSVDGS